MASECSTVVVLHALPVVDAVRSLRAHEFRLAHWSEEHSRLVMVVLLPAGQVAMSHHRQAEVCRCFCRRLRWPAACLHLCGRHRWLEIYLDLYRRPSSQQAGPLSLLKVQLRKRVRFSKTSVS